MKLRSRGGGRRRGDSGAVVVIELVSGMSKPRPSPSPSPRADLFSSPKPNPGFSLSVGDTMLLSESDASMDPRASSTSGNDMSEEFDADEGIESSEPDDGIELCDSSDGREGKDSNGGEGGEGGSGSDGASGSSRGSETSVWNGEKSRLISMLGKPCPGAGRSRGISSISSIFTASSSPPENRFRRGATHVPENSSELS